MLKVGVKGKGGLGMGVVKRVLFLDIILVVKELSFGMGVMEGVVFLGSKELSLGMVVVYKLRWGMMVDEMEMKEEGSSLWNNEIYLGLSSMFVELVKLVVVEKRVVRVRVSMVFLVNKFLFVVLVLFVVVSLEDVGIMVGL